MRLITEWSSQSDDFLADSLELLRKLNALRDASGCRLSERVEVQGYRTWWLIQHQLLWSVLLPYVLHRPVVDRVLAAPEAGGEEPLAADVGELLGLLAPAVEEPEPVRRPASPPQVRGSGRRRLYRLSQILLAVESVAALLLFRLARRDTLFYILDRVTPQNDHDFRLTTIYRELRRRGYRFGEYLHIRGGDKGYRTSWQNLWRRGRPAVFFEILARVLRPPRKTIRKTRRALPVIAHDAADPTAAFLALVGRWALLQAELAASEVTVIRRMLRIQGVRRAIVADEASVAGKIVVACKLEGIPSIVYQHGAFNRYHPGFMAYGFCGGFRPTADLYGLWSRYYEDMITAGDLYDASNVATSGPLRPPEREQLQRIRDAAPLADGQPVRVLLVSEPYAIRSELVQYVDRLVAESGLEVRLKLRPGEGEPDHSSRGYGVGLQTVRTGTVYDSLVDVDVIAGTYSSVLAEAILALKPAVVLNTRFRYGHHLAESGAADLASSPDSAVETIARAARLDNAERLRRRDLLWGSAPLDGAARLLDRAEETVWR